MGESTGIIEQYAAHLEAKATRLVIRSTLFFGLAGALLGGFPLLYTHNAVVPSHLGFATLLLGAAAGAYLGYTFGERKAIEVRMQARLALHQLQVEQSLMQSVARTQAPVVQAPAPAAPVAQPAPAPVAPAPVAPPPVAPAPVAPAPVAPPPVAPAPPIVPVAPAPPVVPVSPAPLSPAPLSPAPVAPPVVAPAPIAPPPLTPATPPAATLPRLVEPQQMPPLSSAG
jgi:hypothetical protein